MATATNSQDRQNDQSRMPVFARRHRRLQIAVWQNDSAKGVFFTASLQRSYKDGDEWKQSQASLNRDDLLVAAKLLNWAHSAVATAAAGKATPESAKRPVSSQRFRSLEVAIWRREGDQDPFYTVSLKRSYKVEEKWNESAISLSNDDLLPMIRLLERAHDAIDDLYEKGDYNSTESENSGSSNLNNIPF